MEKEYGVFNWTKENRYPRAAAIKIFKSDKAAQKYCDRHFTGEQSGYVAREILS